MKTFQYTSCSLNDNLSILSNCKWKRFDFVGERNEFPMFLFDALSSFIISYLFNKSWGADTKNLVLCHTVSLSWFIILFICFSCLLLVSALSWKEIICRMLMTICVIINTPKFNWTILYFPFNCLFLQSTDIVRRNLMLILCVFSWSSSTLPI